MNESCPSRGTRAWCIAVSALVAGILAQPLKAETPVQAGGAVQDTIRGTVTDEAGQPVPAVTVRVTESGVQAITDAEGSYALPAPAEGVLLFTHIGFQAVEVDIAGRTTIDVQMQISVAQLEELLVTGYTTQRRADIIGAVASVDMESLGRQTSSSVIQRLEGSVSGVTVNSSGSPGARSTVRIRGVSSFQNNDPLYIIDGTPVVDSYANWLNPNDVESIQVLKDASAASIYGARASNGVVIIETKKGSEGPTRITLDTKFGLATPYRGYDDFMILDALEYHEVVRQSHVNAGQDVPTNIYGDPTNPSVPRYIYCGLTGGGAEVVAGTCDVDEGRYSFPDFLIMPGSPGTNWWDAVFGSANVWDVNLRVAGGSATERYSLSFNYFDQEGTAAYNRFQRGSVRLNTDFDLGWVSIGENLNVSFDQHYGGMTDDDIGEGGIIGKNMLTQPVVPVYDIAGNFASGKTSPLGNNSNPLKEAWANKDDVNRNVRMFGNAFARVDLTDALLLNTTFGFDVGQGSLTGFNPIFPEDSEPNLVSSVTEETNTFRSWVLTNTMNYSESFGDRHDTNILVGQAAQRNTFRDVEGSMAGLVTTDINGRYIQDALGDPDTKNIDSEGGFSTLLSYFGKIDYNYDDRYYLSFTVRRDGSSRLGPNNRWGTFPAFNVGWRLSEESFLSQSTFFTNLMLRLGWGLTGNQDIAPGRTVDQYGGSTGDVFYDIGGGGSIIRGFRQTSFGNEDLKWEENQSVNAGVDVEFFSGRVSLDLDVYQRDTDNLLFNPPLPATAGIAAAPIVNVGKMRNTGVDFGIGVRGTIGDDMDWNARLSGAHYKNEIVRIDGDRDFFFGPIGTRFTTRGTTINMLGQPIGSFYGFVVDGIFQSQEEIDQLDEQASQMADNAQAAYQDGAAPGRFRFQDVNGDGRVTAADETIIGDPHPDFTAGLDLGFRWRRWDFSANLFGTFGNDIFDVQKEFYVFRNFNTNVRRDLLTESAIVENGRVTNPDAKYPRLDVTDDFSRQTSSFYVEDGSYVRLRSLQLGYTVPDSWVPGFSGVRVWLQGENLFTITGYSGLDPSLPAISATASGMDIRDQARGIDRGVYPTSRMISIGFGVDF